MRRRPLLRHVAIVVAAGAAACASSLEPTDHTAVVKAGPWGRVYRGGYVAVASLNGIAPSWRLRSAIEVPAGDQAGVFDVYLCQDDAQQCYWTARAQFAFRAEAGRTYRTRAREERNGSNRFWVWLEDQATGSVAGGNPPSGPTSGE